MQEETRTILLYEAPHHLLRTLEELWEVLGDRRVTLLRELTKKYESAERETLCSLIAHYKETEPRGECVLVIEGKSFQEIEEETKRQWETMSMEEHMKYYETQGYDRKSAMKAVAKDRGIGKREVYQALLP